MWLDGDEEPTEWRVNSQVIVPPQKEISKNSNQNNLLRGKINMAHIFYLYAQQANLPFYLSTHLQKLLYSKIQSNWMLQMFLVKSKIILSYCKNVLVIWFIAIAIPLVSHAIFVERIGTKDVFWFVEKDVDVQEVWLDHSKTVQPALTSPNVKVTRCKCLVI